MGAFDYFRGSVRCPNCRAETGFDWEQTKLFDADFGLGHNRIVRVGSVMTIDGLGDFVPLFPWKPGDRLVVVPVHLGGCCGEAIWLKSFFSVAPEVTTIDANAEFTASYVEEQAFSPARVADYGGVHWVKIDLLYHQRPWLERATLDGLEPEERARRIAAYWASME